MMSNQIDRPPSDATPEFLENWRKQLAQEAERLGDEISERSQKLSIVNEKLALVGQLLELGGRKTAVQDQAPKAPECGLQGTPSRIDTPSLEETVERVLNDAGKPLHVSKLREGLKELGCPIPGRGDDANIIVRLRAAPDRFTRTARGTYALSNWGIPELKPKARRLRSKSARSSKK